MNEKEIPTEYYVDEVNIKDIPKGKYGKLWYATGKSYLDFGQASGIEFYSLDNKNNSKVYYRIMEGMNILSENNFELVSFHEATRYYGPCAILRKS